MKLEVGKKYVCKNRPDVDYVEIVRHCLAFNAPYEGKVVYNDGKVDATGHWPEDGTNPQWADWELVSEWVDPSRRLGSSAIKIVGYDELAKLSEARCPHERIVNLSFMHVKMGCALCGKLQEDIDREGGKIWSRKP